MKKYIFLLSLFWATIISAQNITRLEYSIDGFVAEGKGTTLEIPGNSTELIDAFNVDISGLEPGIHTIHFRAMNADGVWSFAAKQSFYVAEPAVTPEIVAVEYSIDEFAKEGEGEMIALQNGANELDSTLLLDISGMRPGIHNIYMRAKNELGVWSLPVSKSFVISEPDTAKIENIFYRFYNDDFESTWMTASVDPARENVDSTIMASVSGLDLDDDYTIEFYAQNNMGARGFSAYLSNVSLMMNHSPLSTKDMLELSVSTNQLMELSMDSLFSDEDLNFGDSLVYALTDVDNQDLLDFTEWESGSLLSFSPVSGYSGNYSFWLKTSDLAGESDSIQVMFTVTSSTGIDDLTSENGVIFYPNPTTGNLNIELGKVYPKLNVSVKNVLGQEVISKKYSNVNRLQFSIDEIKTGIYFIHLTDKNEQKAVLKVLKK